MRIAKWFWGFPLALGIASGQVNFTQTFDLKLGLIDAREHQMLDFGGVAVAVFRRLPHPAACPTTRPGDFELRKLNPGAGTATREYIGACGVIDSVAINTDPVWEIYTAEQKPYYIQLVELLPDHKVKIRITSQIPVLRFTGGPSVSGRAAPGAGYQVDGKKPGAAYKAPNVLVGPRLK